MPRSALQRAPDQPKKAEGAHNTEGKAQPSRPYQCPSETCTQQFTLRHNARRHIRNRHKGEHMQALLDRFNALPKIKTTIPCKYCPKTVGSPAALTQHVKSAHPGKQTGKFSCDYCHLRFRQMRQCLSHMKKDHTQQLQRDGAFATRVFHSSKAFNNWLEELKQEDCCNYSPTSPMQAKGSSFCGLGTPVPVLTRQQYVCTRDEAPRTGPVMRHRKLRKEYRGLGFCPARIFVELSRDGCWLIDMYRRHSHEKDIRHMNIPRLIKTWVIHQATRKVAAADIYRSLPQAFPGNIKADMVTYQDVYRLSQIFKRSKGQGGRPPGDTSTVPQGSKGQGGRTPGDTSIVPHGSTGHGHTLPGRERSVLGYSPSVLLLQRDFRYGPGEEAP